MTVVVRPWKLPCRDDDLGAVAGDALDAIAPAARGLDRGLDRLGAGVHRQRGVEPGQLAQLGEERAEPVVEIGARRHREAPRLRREGVENARMSVAVACRRVGAHHVDIAPAGRVPQMRALAARQHDGERLVVVSAVPVLQIDGSHDTPPHNSHCRFSNLCGGCGLCGGSDGAPRRIRRWRAAAATETAVC